MSNRNKSLAFLIFLIIAVFAIVGYRFQNYYITRDYVLNVFTPCDPTAHSCFAADESIADPSFQTGPCEKVEIIAHYVPPCLEEHTCKDFSCEGITSCKISYCSNDLLDVGESCITTRSAGTSTEKTTRY